jgi:hypothetical protein
MACLPPFQVADKTNKIVRKMVADLARQWNVPPSYVRRLMNDEILQIVRTVPVDQRGPALLKLAVEAARTK